MNGYHVISCGNQRGPIVLDYPAAERNLALALTALGTHDEAMACYRRCLKANPDDVLALDNLATALREHGMVDEAIACKERDSFLTAPIAFTLWYMSMDLTPLLFGRPEFTWNERLWVSVCFGLLMLLASFLVDCRTKEDYSFWGYLFGMLAFWFGLSLMENGSELSKFLYCLVNLGLMLVSVLLHRRVFIVFGSLGVFGYLGYLSYRVFQDSLLFPVALSLIGVLVIFLGVKYQRNRAAIERVILAKVPLCLKQILPSQRIAS
jgi:tetratricopeptide (TPR) repeat protein